MKSIWTFSLFLLVFLSCDSGTNNSSATDTLNADNAVNTSPSNSTNSDPSVAPETSPEATIEKILDCQPKGKMIADNQFWAKKQDVLVRIIADSTTTDIDLGDSYRILEAYDSKNCERIFRKTLPINSSPDFPYYIDERSYDEALGLVCCQSFDAVYCFDTKQGKLLAPLEPQFLRERESQDAQSGMPKGVKLYGQYLFGLSQDYGSFAFDCSNPNQPKALLPAAEYLIGDNDFHALYLLPKGQGQYEAIVPGFDENEMTLVLKNLFDQALAVNPVIAKQVRNNRFIVMNTTDDSGAVAVDMEEEKRVTLPADVAKKSVQEILKWLKSN
ncbi:MAG: hypothetical protein AAFP19_13115 [Bacteroidota bacterium]